ncbi:uncharacterized protein I206_105390 [Kwoniella pini CBS 10737]|uniref:Uncharacterized protein n=1 Tax=Kwoniella pini CBS 10737 TaxID=1296096 RepID=A0A1B9I4D4_9TREE|nr:uncharacterized protein I206_03703 [Kwoniella pini CBS 10737]OCF50382.1 hypothetical protein I206_03703 [Kwoniella pini CBS 10737]
MEHLNPNANDEWDDQDDPRCLTVAQQYYFHTPEGKKPYLSSTPPEHHYAPRVNPVVELNKSSKPIAELYERPKSVAELDKSPPSNWSYQVYSNCHCTELIEGLPNDEDSLRKIKNILGRWTCPGKEHSDNFVQRRSTLCGKSRDEVTNILLDHQTDLHAAPTAITFQTNFSKELEAKRGPRDLKVLHLRKIVSEQRSQTSLVQMDAGDITIHQMVSGIMTHKKEESTALLSRYDPCGCCRLTTLAEKCPGLGTEYGRAWRRELGSQLKYCPLSHTNTNRTICQSAYSRVITSDDSACVAISEAYKQHHEEGKTTDVSIYSNRMDDSTYDNLVSNARRRYQRDSGEFYRPYYGDTDKSFGSKGCFDL